MNMAEKRRSESIALWFAGSATLLAAVGIWFNYADQVNRQIDHFDSASTACAYAISTSRTGLEQLELVYHGALDVPVTEVWDAYSNFSLGGDSIRRDCFVSGLLSDPQGSQLSEWEDAMDDARSGAPVLLPLTGPGVVNSDATDWTTPEAPKLSSEALDRYRDELDVLDSQLDEAPRPTWLFWTWTR
jgi:hypothetical protein